MENNIRTLMDKYVLDSLTKEEIKQLEREKSNNPNLETELEEHLDIYKGIQYAADLELLQMVKNIHAEEIGSLRRKKNQNPKKKIGLVLLIIGILSLLFYGLWIKMNPSASPKQIYASHYSLYMPSLNVRGANSEAIVEQFDRFYKKKAFKEAFDFIQPYLGNSSNEIKLVAAICAIEDNQINQSITILDDIISTEDYFFIDQARWYKAMALLKDNRLLEVKSVLQQLITDKKADHYDDAIKILELIDRE